MTQFDITAAKRQGEQEEWYQWFTAYYGRYDSWENFIREATDRSIQPKDTMYKYHMGPTAYFNKWRKRAEEVQRERSDPQPRDA